jgi:hypothetical protein
MAGSRLKLTGYQDAHQIDRIISSDLVDVVYVDEITQDAIYLIPDGFDVVEEFEWIEGVLRETFAYRELEGLQISLENPTPHA